MADWFAGAGDIFSAFFANDAWMIRQALRTPAAWPVGLLATLLGGLIFYLLYRFIPWVERKLEPTIMVTSYLMIGAIIFVEVIRRFTIGEQAPWSTTIPPFLFLIMTWVGCSYNVKLRTHLAFAEFRSAMPRAGQFAALTMDALLWIGFSWVVLVTSSRLVANSASNFQIMLGTDNILQWWFLVSVPLSFLMLVGRVIENWLIDLKNYREGNTLIEQAVIGAD
ncbi:TRAP transporter small permease subunit [Roseobacter sp. HKCCD9010]|uniref:TRAP transporter small permease n=1 Tax=unclassified Roseobacter TaxID=196798 RepID=UPI001490C7FF|nr:MULTISPECIES: TRAP transporter small permease subunit [unclassified Roseobacter]MBF9052009.1 TRAP transporter small permease subunit [Rhodobacterales bacterium HKCCD4356]NNV10354.1 TRAP transporter small permease subunit [Roseobacter sp. HKCCD7357]NNV18174.1 TRAP transporter small permease subunit [Roseobacter sp. HKCCD8768]NNV27634.1 TRAP transporter small permease subunit [Roseobacter sp. HKCCD8192]NNV31900.1 TRAP transporter small permease subunit [Roseobacter sp. HKCCD9061]